MKKKITKKYTKYRIFAFYQSTIDLKYQIYMTESLNTLFKQHFNKSCNMQTFPNVPNLSHKK